MTSFVRAHVTKTKKIQDLVASFYHNINNDNYCTSIILLGLVTGFLSLLGFYSCLENFKGSPLFRKGDFI